MTTLRTTLLLAGCLMAAAAHGARADSLQKITISADDSGTAKFVDGSAELLGHVVLTRGTLVLKADRATFRQDDQGYSYATFYANAGARATFRQKRDGGADLWSEGEAQRIEYDGKNEIVKLFTDARVATIDGPRTTQEARGQFISYNSRSEEVAIFNSADGKSKPGGGRVTFVFDNPPKPKPAPAAEQGKK